MRLPQTVLHPDFCNVTALQDIVKDYAATRD